jgi:putative transposase
MDTCLKYRLSPTKHQLKCLESQLNECRWLYNKLLEERRTAWEEERKSLSYFQQCQRIKELKKEHPSLKSVYSQVLQNVADRLDKAFRAFFRRVKAGETPGYPRFKGYGRYDSFTYTQFGFQIKDSHLELAKVGSIKIKLHRQPFGQIKTCTIRRQNDKWYACFSIECEPQPLPPSEKAIGIDMGLDSFATLSTGDKITNPHFFKFEEKALAKAQRKLSKLEKGTLEYRKAKKVVSRIHERICFKRHNFIHQSARKIVNRFGTICVEDLKVKNMMQNGHLAKSIGDAAWGKFILALEAKAEDAGRRFVRVKPNNTSQLCSRCHLLVPKDLSCRIHSCPYCGLQIDRDLNSAYNILGLGLQSLGLALEAPPLLGLGNSHRPMCLACTEFGSVSCPLRKLDEKVVGITP